MDNKAFCLSPVASQLDHRDFSVTITKSRMVIVAKSEWHARMYANLRAHIAGDKGTASPWSQPELVECLPLGIEGELPPDGTVIMSNDSDYPDFMALGPDAGDIYPPRQDLREFWTRAQQIQQA